MVGKIAGSDIPDLLLWMRSSIYRSLQNADF
jgi:hypothetical protein